MTGKRIFVGTDAQSILKALKTGPHRRYKYLAIDTSPIWKKINEITLFCKEVVLHYVPGHVDILGNTYADNAAKFAASQYSDTEQNQVAPTLSNLKSYLKQKLFDEWCIEMNSKLTPGFRHFLLKARTSRLKMRVGSPRPIQTLFSRYRCNRSESCGEYSRKLRYIMNPSCWFCGHPKETILHLLDDCPGTHSYRVEHNINLYTLAQESNSSMLKIAIFDAWIRRVVPFDQQPPGYRIHSVLNSLQHEKKRSIDLMICPMTLNDQRRETVLSFQTDPSRA